MQKEMAEFVCSDCGGHTWKVVISYEKDKQTLFLECSNKGCINKKKKELGISESNDEHVVIWQEFDITGQLENSDYEKVQKEDFVN